MFRVTIDRQTGGGVTLRLEGRLAAAWVDEFARTIGGLQQHGPLILDLDGLSYADPPGVGLIRDAIGRGARVTGGSPFIGALIGEHR